LEKKEMEKEAKLKMLKKYQAELLEQIKEMEEDPEYWKVELEDTRHELKDINLEIKLTKQEK
jgi:hypothetical protein